MEVCLWQHWPYERAPKENGSSSIFEVWLTWANATSESSVQFLLGSSEEEGVCLRSFVAIDQFGGQVRPDQLLNKANEQQMVLFTPVAP
jgi:hypothetical protein